MVTLAEFADLFRGNGLPKSDFTSEGVPAIHYGQIYTRYGSTATETFSFVSAETAKKLVKVNSGDLVITNTSENLVDVGKSIAWLGENQAVTGGHATVIRHKQNPKYLNYFFKSQLFHNQKRAFAVGTKVIDVSAKSLEKIRVPLPELSVQEEMASRMEALDLLANSEHFGLQAELQLRKKQYEYYRDQLLTFKERV
jgi:type I restriction enzyme S subunit